MRFEIGQNALPRLVPVEPRVSAGRGIHVCRLVEYADRRQAMALPQGEVVGIVRGCYLDRAGAKIAADPAVGHDWDLASSQRQVKHLSV